MRSESGDGGMDGISGRIPLLALVYSVSRVSGRSLSHQRNRLRLSIQRVVLPAQAPGHSTGADAVTDCLRQLSEFPMELLPPSICTKIPRQHLHAAHFQEEGPTMKYFLDSLGWTVFWGVVLTLILYNVVKHALQ
jgi:hypothetical protein